MMRSGGDRMRCGAATSLPTIAALDNIMVSPYAYTRLS